MEVLTFDKRQQKKNNLWAYMFTIRISKNLLVLKTLILSI